MNEHQIQIYMDDFGTGYSSLSYLHQFALDGLKIDRSFVSHMDTSPKHMSLVETIQTLAHKLDIGLIAEGVETPSHWRLLQQIGCLQAQGHLFCKPLPAHELTDYFHAPPSWLGLSSLLEPI